MADVSISRRSLIASSAAAAGLAALGRAPALAQADVRLRMFWWGAKDRQERTEKANRLFEQKNSGMTVAGETLGWGDYWPRLATQVAGRNVADVIQMDYRYIFEYARRGALLPLDEFVPKELNLSDFDAAAVDSGKVDGKIYGVSLGLNSTAFLYDKQLFQSLGLKEPSWDTTWAQFADLATEVTKAAKKDGFSGSVDGAREEPALDVFLRQHGKALYTADGKLGFDEKDIAEWFGFWDDLRKRGGAAAPDVQALDMGQEINTSLLTQGRAAMVFANSNQLVGFQAANKSKLAMTMYPSGGAGAKPGQYLKPSQMLSVYAKTKEPKATIKLVDFYMNDKEGGAILGVERGVPASSAVRKSIEPTLGELDQAQTQYISFITDKVGALPPPPPGGAGEVQQLLRRVNEQVGFGKLTVADGAKQFVTEAKSILARG